MKKAIEIFNDWAVLGRDLGMEEGHSRSVDEMLDFAISERNKTNQNFSFLDVGCGNGWVVRKISGSALCSKAVGIDGASQMIENAKSRGSEEYINIDIDLYEPKDKFDLIHSMEVLYYLQDPASTIKKIYQSWLKPEGRLIVGIDLYHENFNSHDWEEKVGTPMLMLRESEWIDLFKKAGFQEIESWRANRSDKWAGTLVLTGKKLGD
ncbi:class I SAM-dependent methyltransferase [Gammaproteobacteria bacterium]|nr:class I SAM-dependent methyltransferase [Gammaproteobacteria bacterium]